MHFHFLWIISFFHGALLFEAWTILSWMVMYNLLKRLIYNLLQALHALLYGILNGGHIVRCLRVTMEDAPYASRKESNINSSGNCYGSSHNKATFSSTLRNSVSLRLNGGCCKQNEVTATAWEELKERTMKTATFFLVLSVGLANAQLNFEGNPLTENTEYKAEESRSSEKNAGQETTANVMTAITERSIQSVYPIDDYVNNQSQDILIDHQEETSHPEEGQNSITAQTSRQLSSNTYNTVNPAKLALNTFLNSKTPEESRLSLDHYLQSREVPQSSVIKEQTTEQVINNQQSTQQLVPRINQQPTIVSSPVNQQLLQQRQILQTFPVNQQQQLNEQLYNAPVNLQDVRSPASNAVGTSLMQQQLLQPYVTGLQARNDMFYPAGWPHRVRRVRGKPFPYAQSRLGPGFYGGPPPVPFKPKGPPVEVIYTKPPGFHRGPLPLNNPPVPYEDASAWFPEADHPPPSKDVYYSQLYAQSYDPHYYNYIAKTGKIKPHLYGKLGKYHEEESDGIWAELYRGFKKHGLKNIMTPTFLLGMTLPVVTLMLTALVQKRSLSRSDSRELSSEDTIQEYLEQIQRAIECYEKKRWKRETNVGGC